MALGIEDHKSRLMQAADTAGATLYKEMRLTKRKWAHELAQPIIDAEECQIMKSTDLDAIAAGGRVYIDEIKSAIRHARGKDDLLARLSSIAQYCVYDCSVRGMDPDVLAHVAHYVEELATRYEALHHAQNANSVSEEIAAKLHALARFTKMTINSVAYAEEMVFHLNPLELDEEQRPHNFLRLGGCSYFMDHNVPHEQWAKYEFDDEAIENVKARARDSFIAIVAPYLPDPDRHYRLGPEICHLIGMAQDAVNLKYHGTEKFRASREALYKDDELVEETRQLLAPIILRYPSMCDNFEQFLDASDMLERTINGEKGGHAASVRARRESNVVQLFGPR